MSSSCTLTPFHVSRRYKAGEEWKQTTNFHKSHLPKLIEALDQAAQWIAIREPSAADTLAS